MCFVVQCFTWPQQYFCNRPPALHAYLDLYSFYVTITKRSTLGHFPRKPLLKESIQSPTLLQAVQSVCYSNAVLKHRFFAPWLLGSATRSRGSVLSILHLTREAHGDNIALQIRTAIASKQPRFLTQVQRNRPCDVLLPLFQLLTPPLQLWVSFLMQL